MAKLSVTSSSSSSSICKTFPQAFFYSSQRTYFVDEADPSQYRGTDRLDRVARGCRLILVRALGASRGLKLSRPKSPLASRAAHSWGQQRWAWKEDQVEGAECSLSIHGGPECRAHRGTASQRPE
eukprot:scaffold736_cov254-Pinguiococcus_pyrenoidosus.AAC.40